METKLIGNKITAARKKMNLSQAQLADHLFISAQAVGKWERGESMPDIVTFMRLAELTGVDLNYFSSNFQSTAPEVISETVLEKSAASNAAQPKQKKTWDMSQGNWVDADFSGLKNLHEKFSSSNMKNCLFIGSDMAGILLKNNNVDKCDFRSSDLSKSHIQASNLVNNLFSDCSLKDAELTRNHIKNCNFSSADFTGATLKSNSFQKNLMTSAVLHRTSFSATHFADIVFDCNLEDCDFKSCHFSRVSFKNATLTNTFFKGGNLKRIQFIDCHADRMTYEFLKNGKADLTGISLLAD